MRKKETMRQVLARAALARMKKENPTPGLFEELELRQARAMVDAVFAELVTRVVRNGERVSIARFGTFFMAYRAGNTKRATESKHLAFSAAGVFRGLPKAGAP